MTLPGFAQQNYQDVVYLKNGGITRGIIIEQIPEKQIKIETIGHNVVVYQVNEIDRMTREPITPEIKEQSENHKKTATSIEVGGALGTGDWGYDYLRLHVVHGYNIGNHSFLGLGVGLREYIGDNWLAVPIFANYKYHFPGDKHSPYLSCDLGYTFYPEFSFERVGLFLNPSIGMKLNSSKKYTFHVALGYEMQSMEAEYSVETPYTYTTYNKYITSGSLCLSLGVTF